MEGMLGLVEREILLHKITVEKHNQFDHLMKYSVLEDEKYIRRIGEFYKSLEILGVDYQYDAFNNIFEEFNSSISNNMEKTVNNILNLYGKTYLQIEELKKGTSIKGLEKNDKIDHPNVLVIDDDKLLLNIIEKNLGERDYNIITCKDPLEGIEILKEKKIELIILDMVLPGIDGFQMTKTIREMDPLIPIIIISKKEEIGMKINALKLGADDYITKPINIEELDARIHSTLDRNEKYKIISIGDSLTGVHNKEYFWDRANEEKELYFRNKRPFSMALIDLDNFKRVNDSSGHLMGDQVLKCFAMALKDILRDTDLIFRFGGDEFIVIFPETNEQDAKKLMENFKNSLNHSYYDIKCSTLKRLKFSVGITEIKNIDDTIEKMFERMDYALYEVKRIGGDKILIYED